MRGPSRLLLLALCACAAALSGCLSGKDDSIERERRARTMFEDLITRGRTQPAGIDEFDGDDTFSDVAEAYADDPPVGPPVSLPGDAPAGGGER